MSPELIHRLSFTHLSELIQLPDATQRRFYELECIRGNWSVRELRRQIDSLYYQRSGLSKNKAKLSAKAQAKAETLQPAQIIRDPYVFEFLGIRAQDAMGESDLEDALLDRLQEFLLEMGHGFCFEARQKRLLIGDEHFFVDLVFYHRVLKCHVLVELKTTAFSHEHLGQLNTYVAYYKKHEMTPGDQPPIGILLCTRKNEALVEFALGDLPNKLFVSRYAVEMPKKQEMEGSDVNYELFEDEDGSFLIQDTLLEEFLTTPQGVPIVSNNKGVIGLIVSFVNDNGPELKRGMSAYGLESSFIDFGFDQAPEEKRAILREALNQDMTFSDKYSFLHPTLTKTLGWRPNKKEYLQKLEELSGRQMCIVNTFCANYGLLSIAYHLFIEGKQLPDALARHWCGVFEHVNRFDNESMRRKALAGAFVDQNSLPSISPDPAQIKCCGDCCDRIHSPGSLCLIRRTIEGVQAYALLAKSGA